MNLNAKSLGLSGGILWGAMMFIVTIISVLTGYGTMFLEMMTGVYPGYEISYLGSFVGLVYGFIDAFIGFYILAWLYNRFNR